MAGLGISWRASVAVWLERVISGGVLFELTAPVVGFHNRPHAFVFCFGQEGRRVETAFAFGVGFNSLKLKEGTGFASGIRHGDTPRSGFIGFGYWAEAAGRMAACDGWLFVLAESDLGAQDEEVKKIFNKIK